MAPTPGPTSSPLGRLAQRPRNTETLYALERSAPVASISNAHVPRVIGCAIAGTSFQVDHRTSRLKPQHRPSATCCWSLAARGAQWPCDDDAVNCAAMGQRVQPLPDDSASFVHEWKGVVLLVKVSESARRIDGRRTTAIADASPTASAWRLRLVLVRVPR